MKKNKNTNCKYYRNGIMHWGLHDINGAIKQFKADNKTEEVHRCDGKIEDNYSEYLKSSTMI